MMDSLYIEVGLNRGYTREGLHQWRAEHLNRAVCCPCMGEDGEGRCHLLPIAMSASTGVTIPGLSPLGNLSVVATG